MVSTPSEGLYLVTARHNVTGRDQNTGECLSPKTGITPNAITIHHHARTGLGNWAKITQRLYDGDGRPAWREHPVYKGQADFVALRISVTADMLIADESWRARDTLYYQIGRTYFPIARYPSVPVSIISYPFGQSSTGSYPIWLTGHLASEPDLSYRNLPILLVDCRTRPGCSGAPVIIYSKGSFNGQDGGTFVVDNDALLPLGIYTGRIRNDADIGMVWKWSAVCDLFSKQILSKPPQKPEIDEKFEFLGSLGKPL